MYLCVPPTRRGRSDDPNFLCLFFPPRVFCGSRSYLFPFSVLSQRVVKFIHSPKKAPETRISQAAPEKKCSIPLFFLPVSNNNRRSPRLHKCQAEVVLSLLCISHAQPLNAFFLHAEADSSCSMSPLKLETSLSATIIRRGSQLCVRECGKLLVLKR